MIWTTETIRLKTLTVPLMNLNVLLFILNILLVNKKGSDGFAKVPDNSLREQNETIQSFLLLHPHYSSYKFSS